MNSTGYPYGPRGMPGGGQQTPTVDQQAFDYGNIDPSQAFQGKQGASDLMGQLTRAQWQDWKTRFSPYVDELIGEATDPEAGQNAATEAREAVGSAFDASRGLRDSNQASFGIQLTPEQRKAQDRIHNVTQAAAEVSAGNEARVSAQDRQKAIMAGGAGLSMVPEGVR